MAPNDSTRRRNLRRISVALLFLTVLTAAPLISNAQRSRWTEERANAWYAKQPWPVGSNYLPADAINQLEMWQADTFNPKEIDRELGWAESIGMNTMRVFLHDLLWQQDEAGFKQRIDTFLTIAAKHHIKPVFVLFDSCWDPMPKLGPQHPPIPGVHNSGWVQSPGRAMADPAEYPRLKTYIHGVVAAFANDDRILAWDVWNEPGNTNSGSYGKLDPPNKEELVLKLLPQVFEWVRSANPSQPLTSGIWGSEDWSSIDKMTPIEQVQFKESDIISFHNYGWPEVYERKVHELQQYHRPIICTEYMARGAGSTFDTILPIAEKNRVGAINWGFVAGKSQTYLPWDSWRHPYTQEEPPVWFHDVFHPDGTPYRVRETEIIRQLTQQAAAQPASN
ncbi:cellulase family glycosylhydrolase [Silvibacterium acidisoli]|uniref:cellulase family glycosylhydrolase n=1 Tax=Acidobacteriaceae bacterium ZG23-2 TaxID=2883246 RepID=UPI00406D3FB2